MLPLDSPRWKDLHQAYGSAKNIPQLLKDLENDPKRWDDIWSNLCHQNDIFSATHAAIPHLVSLAQKERIEHQLWTLIFCGTVKSSGILKRGPVPPDLLEASESSMKTLQGMSVDIAQRAVKENLLKDFPPAYLVQAVLSLKYGSNPECPECEEEFSFNTTEKISASRMQEIILRQDFEVTCSECGCLFSYNH